MHSVIDMHTRLRTILGDLSRLTRFASTFSHESVVTTAYSLTNHVVLNQRAICIGK